MNIYIASDHRGVALKQVIISYLSNYSHKKLKLTDLGCKTDERVDYPTYAHDLCKHVREGEAKGILICHTANGMSIAANKHHKIRAALAFNSKISELARLHNDANVICLPAGFLTNNEATRIIDKFLETDFMGDRHRERLEMIDQFPEYFIK